MTDWTAIERMPEFRELVDGRRRFAWIAGSVGVGFGALYVVLVATSPGLIGTRLAGSFSLGFAGGAALVLLTWAITLAYMRRSSRVWSPLEARVRDLAAGRAEVSADGDARAAATPAGRRARAIEPAPAIVEVQR
jgi:uncharacterized membrane protein (DUF485 family)